MTRKVFYVESPGQLINAMEGIYEFQNKWLLIVRFNGNKVNDEQLDKVLEFYDARKDAVFSQGNVVKITNFSAFLKYFTLAIVKNRFKDIYVGCHKSKFLKLYNLLGIPLYLLDDGIASLVYLNTLNKQASNSAKQSFNLVRRLSLYTSLPEEQLNGVNFQRHQFSYLKSQAKSIPFENAVHFFGAKYIEANILTERNYEILLVCVLKYFTGKEVYYIPHRAESRERLSKYESLGYKIYFPDYPSELELVVRESKPVTVAGFFTASLFTTSLIIPDVEVVSFEIPQEMAINGSGTLDYIYNFFSRFAKVVNFKENT